MSKKGRRRQRHEIGVQGSEAIRRYDRATEFAALSSNLPSLDELERHWKTCPPDGYGNTLMNNLDNGRWKIVIPVENMYATFVGVTRQLQQKNPSLTFEQFKDYTKSKYYVDDDVLDCFIVQPSKKGVIEAARKMMEQK